MDMLFVRFLSHLSPTCDGWLGSICCHACVTNESWPMTLFLELATVVLFEVRGDKSKWQPKKMSY